MNCKNCSFFGLSSGEAFCFLRSVVLSSTDPCLQWFPLDLPADFDLYPHSDDYPR